MAIELMFQVILLLLSVQLHALIAKSHSIGLPGCQIQCGSISIPFPFGTNSSCYLEKRFQVFCNTSGNHSKLMLILNNATHLEVLQTPSVEDRIIQVRYPIVYENCENMGTINKIVDLNNTPFAISSTRNKFTAVCCNNLALIMLRNQSIGGCMPFCEKDIVPTPTCNGIGCCQTAVPSKMKVFDPALLRFIVQNESVKSDTCKFAFIVDDDWFSQMYKKESKVILTDSPSFFRNNKFVPVTLDWEIDADKYKGYVNNSWFGMIPPSPNSSSYAPATLSSFYSQSCEEHLSPTISSNITICKCWLGFEGNPYIIEDINECEVPKRNPCEPLKMRCENLYGSYSCHSRLSQAKITILGISVGLGSLFIFSVAWRSKKIFKNRRNKKLKEKFFKQNGGLLLQEQLSSGETNVERVKMFSSKDLEKATDKYNMSRMLGQGGQGTVYKGMLEDGRIVAVKKSIKLDEGKLKQFINEVVILSQINHRNVVKLLGCCLETEVPMLVYEFIPNGTFFEFLHDQNEEIPSTWDMRLRIATDIAGALSYLHSAASVPIYHRDIKSTNILLDDKYRAKMADFGISRSVCVDQSHITTLVQGTFGYLDPEFFWSNQFTDKSDVYSFAVVLVELLTGQKPILAAERSEENRSLVSYFMRSIDENRLFDILDARILSEEKKEEILAVANLAKRCLNLSGRRRPTMKEITVELEGIQKTHKDFNVAKNYEVQVEYDRNETMEHWDLFSTSTVSELGSHSGTSFLVDAKPLLSTYQDS